jgi:hypothetical protein
MPKQPEYLPLWNLERQLVQSRPGAESFRETLEPDH